MERKEAKTNRKKPYTVVVRGRIPPDLSHRISELHALAILHRPRKEGTGDHQRVPSTEGEIEN